MPAQLIYLFFPLVGCYHELKYVSICKTKCATLHGITEKTSPKIAVLRIFMLFGNFNVFMTNVWTAGPPVALNKSDASKEFGKCFKITFFKKKCHITL